MYTFICVGWQVRDNIINNQHIRFNAVAGRFHISVSISSK